MRRLLVGLVVAASLAAAGVASAGGWATVGLSSLPKGIEPGEPWVVDVTVLQHGRTPLAGVEPTVTIRNEETGREIVYEAVPAGETGVYRARVVFPEAGTWSYEVYDGFVQYGGAQVHTFAPVKIGPAPAPAARGSSSFPLRPVLGGAALALTASALALAWRRRPGATAATR